MHHQLTPKKIGALAHLAMLSEVSATPKPGLVDRMTNGAHDDMDFFTFLASATALRTSFDTFAELGRAHAKEPVSALLPHLQAAGIIAERHMFAATHGVNTHKGMIFSLGLLAGTLCGLLVGWGVYALWRRYARVRAVRADRVLHGVAHTSGGYSVTSLRLLMMAFVATYLFIALYALVR